MTTKETIFEFTMRAVDVDDSGYYYARWDKARNLKVRGATKQAAINKAAKMLGPEPHGSGWSWHFITDDIREVAPCGCGQEADR